MNNDLHLNQKEGFLLNIPKKDYSFKNFFSGQIIDNNAKQSFFKGSLFRDCIIEKTVFDRCDFERTSIAKCSIKDTSFINADIRSSFFSESTFENCIFDYSFINSSILKQCVFKNCSFLGALVSENKINESLCECNIYTGSTYTLNIYNSTSFREENISDCSFYQTIFVDCSFTEVIMNIDALGQVYGIDAEAMRKMHFTLRGETLGEAKEDIVDIITKSYPVKGWDFQLGIFRLSISEGSPYKHIVNIFDIILEKIANDKYITRDDLRFFNEIIKQISKEHGMPLFAITYGMKIIDGIFIKGYDNNQNMLLLENALRVLLNDLNNIFDESMTLLMENSLADYSSDKDITFKLRLNNKTNTNSSHIINSIGDIYDLKPLGVSADFIRYEKGSVIEILTTSVVSVFMLQLFVFGVNGCLIQLTEAKQRLKVLTGRTENAFYLRQAQTPLQNMPVALQAVFIKIFSQIVDENLLKSIFKYDHQNIIDGEIEDSTQEDDLFNT